ncbi:MAG: hypothetical protein ABUL42_03365, partial [Terricaulis silvestris]
DDPAGFLGEASALRSALRFEEANTAFEVGMERFPQHQEIAKGYAELPGGLQQAARRWRLLTTRFPDDPAGYLCVRLAQAGDVAGSVTRLDDNVLLGYLDREWMLGNMSVEVWKRILLNARELMPARTRQSS